MNAQVNSADVVIAGGGPAGMLAGLLFARAGIETLVLEKHGDFLRDFRGDTVHPSTMEILDQLGMLNRFLKRPHDRIEQAKIHIAGQDMTIGDLTHLRTPAPFIAMMPQWDFLDFLKDEAQHFPHFSLKMHAEVSEINKNSGRVTGVTLADGTTIEARKLVILADGRASIARRDKLLPLHDLGAPIDVLWFKLPSQNAKAEGLRGVAGVGQLLAMIGRGDYWQCAYVIPKGQAQAIRDQGIAAFRNRISEMSPEVAHLAPSLQQIEELHQLTVSLDRLERWHAPGLLAIGDAAHAMSPVGGVGINLAIQDAVAAANILAEPISAGQNPDALLAKVQTKRMLPTRLVQAAQKRAHDTVLSPLLQRTTPLTQPPLPMRLLNRFPLLRRIPGRLIGLGIQRERVRSPNHYG